MSDEEKLKKLFQACLRGPANDSVAKVEPPGRAVSPLATPATPEPPAVADLSVAIPAPAPVVANLGLDAAAAEELRVLLEEQNNRKARKDKREKLMFLIVLLVLIGGGCAWFVQAPERVQALKEAIRDIRSAGDVVAVFDKYRDALTRVSVRSKQIDQSTGELGVSSNTAGEKDPYLDAEMGAMMSGEGKTVGQRNRMLQDKFGNKAGANVDNKNQENPQLDPPPAEPSAAGSSTSTR
jgi:hypothetical protein